MTLPRCDSVAALYALQNSTMLTPCWPSAGPTGGAGVAGPALSWSLMTAVNRFLGGMTFLLLRDVNAWSWLEGPLAGARAERARRGGEGVLNLGDLGERELDRRLPAEDRDEHLQLLLLGVDLVDRRGQGRERPVHDGDRLADLEVDDGRGGTGRGGTAAGPRGLRRLGRLGRDRRGEDLDDLVDCQRRGLGGCTHEAGDAGGVAH